MVVKAESVIFEQFGTLVGSTSYLHVHIPLYIRQMRLQHNKYQEYLNTRLDTPEKIKKWLYAGAYKQFNLTAERVRNGDISAEEQNLLRAIDINSRMYWEIAQLHLRDLADIRQNIRSLHNLMPDIQTQVSDQQNEDEVGSSAKGQKRGSPDYDDDSDLTINPEGLFVAQPFPVGKDTCDGGDFGCADVTVPDDVVLEAADEDHFPDFTTTTTTTTTTPTPASTAKPLNVKVQATVIHHAKPKMEIWDQPIRIQKRFAGFVALPLAIAATALGLYNRKQLESLRNELFDVKANTQRLFRITQDLSIGLQQVETALDAMRTTLILLVASNPAIADARMTRIENQLRHRVNAAIHAIQSAIHGRLSIDYLDPKSVNKLFKQVRERANQLGCDLLMEYHTDLFQIETSLLFDGRDGHLILHLPMAPKEGQLRLFRLHPFPLPLFEDKYLIPDVKNDVIAISSTDNRLNIQLAAVELLSCHRMSSLFLCDNFGVLSRRFNTTCLGALYMSLFSEAEKICKFKVVPAEEQVYQIHKGEFIVYSPTPVTVNIRCRNGSVAEKHLKRGSQRFDLSRGCTGELSLHKIVADYSSDLGNDIQLVEWDWEPTHFMDGKDQELSSALEKLNRVKIHAPDLSELKYIASLENSAFSEDNTGSILAGICIVGLIIACLLCGIGCYCWCQRFSCCRGKRAVDRRGKRRTRRRRSASCGLLCCCRSHDERETTVRWKRGGRSEGDSEPDDDEVVFDNSKADNYPGTSKKDSLRLVADLRDAEDRVEERLGTLKKGRRADYAE